MVPPTRSGSRGKSVTRRTLSSRRDGLTPEQRASAGEAIAEAASAMLIRDVAPAGYVALYAAKGSEVETDAIDTRLRAVGLRVVYPRVIADGRVLAFHEVRTDELVPSRFGLREPRPEAPEIAVGQIAAFVVPGLAFDAAGGRIGWGRGHYDATFAAADPGALRIGLAFECQIVDEVPREAHDEPVHFVITEATVRRTT